MKNNPNKFIRHLSDDIVTQNHHLKSEVIKIRKVLRSYQQQMVQQFVKLARQLGEDKNEGFFFQTPQEYLKYFIQVLNRNVMKSGELEKQNKHYQLECQQMRSKNQFLEKITDELTIKQKHNAATIAKLEKQYEDLQQKYNKIQTSSKQIQKKLKLQVFKLKQEIKNLQNHYNIKFLEEKKAILEKANKDVAKLRVEMDMELHQKEKNMKLENDKRDKQIKNLLNYINSLAQKKEGTSDKIKEKAVQRPSMVNSMKLPEFARNHSEIQQETTQSPSSFSFLSEFIKPFTEHTKLLEKISEARKEILQLKNQNRQQNTSSSVLMLSLAQKQNEIDLFNEKFTYLKAKNDEMFEQLTKAKEELDKSIQDKQSMEKYYSERWNTQINKVKYNLEKKFIDRQSSLEEEYKVLSSAIEQQRENLRIKEEIIEQQCEKLKKLNKNLRDQLQLVNGAKNKVEKEFKQSVRKLTEIQVMHNEDMRSTKMRFSEMNNKWFAKMANDEAQIKGLFQQIQKINQRNKLDIINLRKDLQISYELKQKQSQNKQNLILEEKDKDIQKLVKELETHKAYIQSFQREQSQKLDELRKKVGRQKQRQIRDIKVFHFEQVSKMNEKILKLEEKLKVLKNESLEKSFELSNQLAEQQVKLTKQQVLIAQLEIVIKSTQSQNKSFQKQIGHLQNVITSHLTMIASLHTQIKSSQLIVKQKQAEIVALVREKQFWIDDIQNCKKEFEEGFKELKQINERKLSYYRSRIWELQRICQIGGISKKDHERIKSLIEQKKKLEDMLAMKEAQNLILTQVKQYYENKSKQLDSKMVVAYELKDEKKPLFLRKPKRNPNHLKILKTQVSEDLDGFTGREAVQIKRFLDSTRNKERSEGKLQTAAESQYQKNSRIMSRPKIRVNSSLM